MEETATAIAPEENNKDTNPIAQIENEIKKLKIMIKIMIIIHRMKFW